jgi:hypothetical protein
MATAVIVVDLQPEWYSGSHISELFPNIDGNVTALLAMCRASGVG